MMFNYEALWQCYAKVGIDSWRQETEALIRARLCDAAHGDFAGWRKTIETLQSLDADQSAEIRDALMSLSPWRKGPFEVGDISIDSEWRSDLKWARLKYAIATG